MLKIELLPDYINDKNKIRNLGVVWAVGIAVLLFFLLGLNAKAVSANNDAKKDKEEKEALKATTDTNKKKVSDEVAARKIIEDKQKFVLNSQNYNDGWPEAFETIRDVKPADNSIILDSMALDNVKHQTVSLTGFGSDEKAVVRWWMSLRNNTGLFDHVNFDLVPHSYAPVTQASNNGMGGFGGPMSGGPGSGGGGKFGGMPPMMGGGPGSGFPGGSGGMPGGPGMRGGMGGGNRQSSGPAELEGHTGINFTALVVLKQPLAGGIPTPTWPGGGAPAGGGGMFGGPGPGGSGGAPSMSMKGGA